MRLSRDDGSGESASITSQRRMLVSYAADNGYPVYDEYVDDGYSGTNFDRPEFSRLIADIEAGRVNLVITKDLSRLGRDYIAAGQYTEIYFPKKGVRYIAINDAYDSENPNTDIAPFKNILNEMYARDISRKIRSAFSAHMRAGAYVAAFAPYGYQKDPADKHHLIVDERSGAIVKGIFQQAADGCLPGEIAKLLNRGGIPSPAVYRCMTHGGLDVREYSERQEWTNATISKMLRNIVYCGHTAQGKTTKVSFKSSLTIDNPQDQWIIVKNTHEALVSEELFDIVKRRITARTHKKQGKFSNLFSGLAKCADCGHCMSATGTRKKGSPANLVCGSYKLCGSSKCSNHFIDYNVLYEIILTSLKEKLAISLEEQKSILDEVQGFQQSAAKRQQKSGKDSGLKKRLRELDRMIEKLYEDNASGRLSDERMQKLLLKYEQEAKTLERGITGLEASASLPCPTAQASREKIEMFLKQIIDLRELTPNLLFKFVDRIEISQGRYKKNEHGRLKHQTVNIYYRFQTDATVEEYLL